jgi:hypothetical protein
MMTDGRNLEGDQPRQSIRASKKTPNIIRLWPVTLVQLQSETTEHKLAIVSRDKQHIQVIYLTGELAPELFPAIAQTGAMWLRQAIVTRILTNYRARHRLSQG